MALKQDAPMALAMSRVVFPITLAGRVRSMTALAMIRNWGRSGLIVMRSVMRICVAMTGVITAVNYYVSSS